MSLTGQRDTDLMIMQILDDRSLLNLCQTDKYTKKLCENESFWRNRVYNKYNRYGKIEKNDSITWKKLYLQSLFYLDTNRNDINLAMSEAAKDANKNMIDFFIQLGADYWEWGLEGAVTSGDDEIIMFFINLFEGDEDNNTNNLALRGAAMGGHQKWIDFFIEKGANDWTDGLTGAAERGDKKLIDFFIEKGIDNWNSPLMSAIIKGDRELINFFIEKGANEWNLAMKFAALTGNQELINFFIEKGANDWDPAIEAAAMEGYKNTVDFFLDKGGSLQWAMEGAIIGNKRNIINFIINKGFNDWNYAMGIASQEGRKDLVEFFISKGANDWERGLEKAAGGNHLELIDFFVNLGARDFDRAIYPIRHITTFDKAYKKLVELEKKYSKQ